jgi:hypothetical protein
MNLIFLGKAVTLTKGAPLVYAQLSLAKIERGDFSSYANTLAYFLLKQFYKILPRGLYCKTFYGRHYSGMVLN